MRLYTDARRTDEAIGLGFVFDTDDIRDTDARCIEGDFTSMEAEFFALYEGVEKCLEYDEETVFCYVDCKPLVHQMQHPTKKKWKEFKDDLDELLDEFEYWNIKYIPREKNMEADNLSNRCMRRL